MSITATLASALSGLTAATRFAEVTSSNVANAMTEGFARREIQLGSRVTGTTGQGVAVTGIERIVDRALLSDRRIAEASAGDRGVKAGFLAKLERTLGSPDSAGSLSARVAGFESALIAAAARPDSESRLLTVLTAAQGVVSQISLATAELQAERSAADGRIAGQVAKLNGNLARIEQMNGQIRLSNAAQRDTTGLLDQRQRLVDEIASIIPLREIARTDGKIALFSTGGAVLLDGSASEFGFAASGQMSAQMTLASNALSGLTLNGRPVPTAAVAGAVAGGTLAAEFALRDQIAPAAQARLDAVARDLVERFADPAIDGTLPTGAAGLFTDGGGAFQPADEIGLSGRLAVNAAADPDRGGALWRLRDGLGATVQGPPGDAARLFRLQGALENGRSPVSGGFIPGERGFASLVAEMLSGVSATRLAADSEVSFAATRAETLRGMEARNGVDTDQEMQNLLLIEQSYAANAKVIQSVDDLIKILLGM